MAKNKTAAAPQERHVTIKPANFQTAIFHIKGTSPLVINRMSQKAKEGLVKPPPGTNRPPDNRTPEQKYNDARYISKDGWDGFNASAIRCAFISVCRVVNYKMCRAKLSFFTIEDGRDALEPQVPLIRIYGESIMQHDIGRTSTGDAVPLYRPAYHDWSAKLRVRWDADQFSLTDVTNMLSQIGERVGIGEGRYDSKRSAGQGWGCFVVEGKSK